MKYQYIYAYKFYHGTSAAETARRINDEYGAGLPTSWTTGDREELKATVEADPSQSTSEIAAGFGVSDKTALIPLKQIGKVEKLEQWVPHELSESNLQTRVDCCVTLFNRVLVMKSGYCTIIGSARRNG
ncbi:histone-lysine N-methyltransferase SETMAR-like [Bombyx mandarina]|uniref:Histone-lysine N-methyltransferase SETMAR-like n=1 Tax=Bombyx mandarina TaxID=7092 RepID=A0A6J2JZD5_BOMMA|nr:histone-lysine N-methyltransferase SETMAR-like [Bombyx mandarina]